ncbi:metallophosphoesterase [Arthrobacter tecti]
MTFHQSVFAVSDIHGHIDPLITQLRHAGLIDRRGDWTGGDARLWFLGDFFDRGPDAIAVLDLVMRLAGQSAKRSGSVQALLGNHEVLALGMRTFGGTEVPHDGPLPRSFERSWTLNSGQRSDQDRLTETHVDWLSNLPALALEGENLLMHSDTLEYLRWGGSIDAVNASVRAQLRSTLVGERWDLWRAMTTRHAFLGEDGPEAAAAVLARFGGRRIVHGHSIVGDVRGVEYSDVTESYSYADGLVLAIDGGIYEGGPCLLTELAPVHTLPR